MSSTHNYAASAALSPLQEKARSKSEISKRTHQDEQKKEPAFRNTRQRPHPRLGNAAPTAL
jgi:hypothetical protein